MLIVRLLHRAMSFEAFVFFFREGKPAPVSRQRVRDAFGPFLTEGGGFDWRLVYDEQNTSDIMLTKQTGDDTMIRHFSL